MPEFVCSCVTDSMCECVGVDVRVFVCCFVVVLPLLSHSFALHLCGLRVGFCSLLCMRIEACSVNARWSEREEGEVSCGI